LAKKVLKTKLYGKYIIINPKDNVAVALQDLKKGEIIYVNGKALELMNDIPNRYKFAIRNILSGDLIIKYGYPIGTAVSDIALGDRVHIDEVKTNLKGLIEYVYEPRLKHKKENVTKSTFMGYVRENGEVGIRNEIWIINTVGCINNTTEILAKQASYQFKSEVDGIYAFPHLYGCSQLGEDLLSTQKILAGMVNHPNAAEVLVLSLGCENNNIDAFKKIIGEFDPRRVKFLIFQQVDDEIEEGLRLLGELVEHARTYKREKAPISKLKIGLKCGASDGFSGVSANPLVGVFSNILTSGGGTTILTEISEMFGAESILMNRCVSPDIFKKAVRMINDFKNYYLKYGQEIYENPSPGNREGGISTLEEKSLGCIQKGGDSEVTDVLKYGDRSVIPGLNLLSSPGDDIIAITALMAAGCQLILFTTGNGNPLGAAVPTVKISSNTSLYKKKKHWIDFNAGSLLEGRDLGELAGELMDLVLQVASGKVRTLNEIYGYRGISMLKDGATL
jgi:altronate hydrolase